MNTKHFNHPNALKKTKFFWIVDVIIG